MSLSCSTALLRHPRILLRDSTIDRPSPLPDQIAAALPAPSLPSAPLRQYILVAFPAIGHLRPFSNAGLAIFVQKRQRPFRSDGGCREKGVPSSGEKIVITKSVLKNQSSPGGGAWLRPTLGIPW